MTICSDIPSAHTDWAVYYPVIAVTLVAAVIYVCALIKQERTLCSVLFGGKLSFDHPAAQFGGVVLAAAFAIYVVADISDWTAIKIAQHHWCDHIKSGVAFPASFTFTALLIVLAGVTVLVRARRERAWQQWRRHIGSAWIALASAEASLLLTTFTTHIALIVWVPITVSLLLLIVRFVKKALTRHVTGTASNPNEDHDERS